MPDSCNWADHKHDHPCRQWQRSGSSREQQCPWGENETVNIRKKGNMNQGIEARLLSHHFRISACHPSWPKQIAQKDFIWPIGINICISISAIDIEWVKELWANESIHAKAPMHFYTNSSLSPRASTVKRNWCRAQHITWNYISSLELIVAIRIVISEPILVPGTILRVCYLTNTVNHAHNSIRCIDWPWPCFDNQALSAGVTIGKVVQSLKFLFAKSLFRKIPGIDLDCMSAGF